MTLGLILAVVALVFGIVAVFEANGRSWSGWSCICLAAIFLIGEVKF